MDILDDFMGFVVSLLNYMGFDVNNMVGLTKIDKCK